MTKYYNSVKEKIFQFRDCFISLASSDSPISLSTSTRVAHDTGSFPLPRIHLPNILKDDFSSIIIVLHFNGFRNFSCSVVQQQHS